MAKAQGRGRPGIATEPPGIKTPGLEKEPSKHEPLSWRFGRIDFEGEWGWSNLTAEEAPALHAEMAKCEGKTLHNLLKAETIKDVRAEHMVRRAQERLVHLRLEEYDTLWELRLNGKRRVWGLVHGSHFHILWWDPKETACDHVPRRARRRRGHP